MIEDTIAAMTGFNSLERYYPVPEKDHLQQEHSQEAAYENALFKLEESIPISESDNHAIHLQSHLEAGTNAFNSLEQGGDPKEVAVYLQFLLNHAAMHLQVMSQDSSRKQLHSQLNSQMQQLINAFKNLGQQIQAREESQQQAQAEAGSIEAGTDAKERVLQLRADRDMARKDAQTAADIERKQMEAQADIELKRYKESDVRP